MGILDKVGNKKAIRMDGFSLPSKKLLFHKFIPSCVDGEEMFRLGRIVFDFFAERKDIIINCTGCWEGLVTPHVIQQHFPGHDFTFVLDEIL